MKNLETLEALNKLDELTWGFRISKIQERKDIPTWHIFFINPKNKTWYSVMDLKLDVTLNLAISSLMDFENA